MTQIIKLTVKQRCTVNADSSPDVPVNELVSIPPNHYGEFYIRKRFGNKGLDVPKSPFPEDWSGIPEICVINSGANDVELLAGEEIGELHIRYSPPSPLSGKVIELTNTFAVRSGGKLVEVATADGKLYSCDCVYEPVGTDFQRFKATSLLNKSWTIHETKLFSPKSLMIDYKFIRTLTTKEQMELLEHKTNQRNGTIIPTQPMSMELMNQHMHHGYPVTLETFQQKD